MGNSKRIVRIGDICIGGNHPIAIQSMTNTRTEDVEATVSQILALEEAGCEIVRCAVPNDSAADAISEIKKRIHIPLVADIHFDYKLALKAMENGVDKVRINPGNIGDKDKVKAVIDAAKKRNIPIRVGVNSGSLHKEQLEKYGKVTAEGLCESAVYETDIIESFGYDNIVVSIKASDVMMCYEAYKLFNERRDYPLHLGVTEAGTVLAGSIKSSVGLGIMLNDGLGDTIRVSLTGDPIHEIYAAKEILKALGLRKTGIKVVSCPTCGRTSIDLISLANRVHELAKEMEGRFDKQITVAVMGCAVNGPGEAREADIGIAGGDGEGLLFAGGKILRKVPEEELFNVLKEELFKL